MNAKRSGAGDERDRAFGLPSRLANHKPGVEHAAPAPEAEGSKDHQLRRSEPKDVPQGSLAERIAKSRKAR